MNHLRVYPGSNSRLLLITSQFLPIPGHMGGYPIVVSQSQVSPFKSHNPSFHIIISPDWIQSVLGVTFRTRQMHGM